MYRSVKKFSHPEQALCRISKKIPNMGLTSWRVARILGDMTTTYTTADRITTARGTELGTYHVLVDGQIAATVHGAANLAATLRLLVADLVAELAA